MPPAPSHVPQGVQGYPGQQGSTGYPAAPATSGYGAPAAPRTAYNPYGQGPAGGAGGQLPGSGYNAQGGYNLGGGWGLGMCGWGRNRMMVAQEGLATAGHGTLWETLRSALSGSSAHAPLQTSSWPCHPH